MEKTWNWATNFVEKATAHSYLKGQRVSLYHLNALLNGSGDPVIASMYATYKPIDLSYDGSYNLFYNQIGVQSGKTLNLNQLFKLLSNSKIRQWDVAIQVVYARGSAPYKALMPHFRIPFQVGTQQELVNAVNGLNVGLTGITALSAVKTDVDNFANMLNVAYNEQKSSKSNTTTDSNNVEDARIIMSQAQFGNYGLLVNYYNTTPEKIIPFFDVKLLSSVGQVDFYGHLKPGKLHVVCKHTFAAADIIEVVNTNPFKLVIFLGYIKDAAVPAIPFVIPPASTTSLTAEKLGDLANTYLIIANPDGTTDAPWEVLLG